MADSSVPPSDEAKSQQTRELLFKRHPQLQAAGIGAGGSATASPVFGGVGTRQFLAKQTPGSVTSASSYEDGASYDGFSEEGTPAALPEIRVRVAESKTGATELQGTKHQPTKRLSSPSRRSLARQLLGTTTTTHGVFAAEGEGDVEALDTSSPSAASSSMVTRRVLRRTDVDGTVHEEIQYVDAEGTVVKTEGSITSATQSSSVVTPGKTTVTRRMVTPGQHTTLRRVVTRHTDADGQVREVVKVLDADGRVVSTEGGGDVTSETSSTTSSVTKTTPGKSTVTRRRVVRRTGADGKVQEEVQYMDANDNIVQIGEDAGPASQTTSSQQSTSTSSVVTTPGRTTVTRRVVSSPAKTLRRRIVRRTGTDGKVVEEIQYLDAEGNVVSSEGGGSLHTTSSFTSQASSSSSGTPSRRTVTRRRVVMRKTGPDGKVREEVKYLDADGHEVSSEGAPLSASGGNFATVGSVTSGGSDTSPSRRSVTRRRVVTRRTGSDGKVHDEVQYLDADGKVISSEGGDDSQEEKFSTPPTPSRLVVTRRVVSPARVVKRTYVSKSGGSSESGQDSQDEVQSLDDEDTRSVTSVTSETSIGGTPSRRVIKRRVVTTPRHVVRRTMVRKDGSESGMESQDEMQSVDESEGSVSGDSSRGVSSSRTTSVTQSVTATPGRTIRRRVSVKMGDDGEPHEDVQYLAAERQDTTSEHETIPAVDSFHSDATTPTRKNMTTVTEPMEGESVQSPEKIGLTPSVVWDYFTGSDQPEGVDKAKPVATAGSDEEKVPIPTGISAPVVATSTISENEKTLKSDSDALRTTAVDGATGVIVASAAKAQEDKEPSNEEDASKPLSVSANAMATESQSTSPADEPSVVEATTTTTVESTTTEQTSGGFWNFFGKADQKEAGAPADTAKLVQEHDDPINAVAGAVELDVVPDSTEEVENLALAGEAGVHARSVSTDVPRSPTNDLLSTAEIGGTAGTAVMTAAVTVEDEAKPDMSPATEQATTETIEVPKPVTGVATAAEVVPGPTESTTTTTTTTTSETTEERGFWSLFGKSVPKKPEVVDDTPETVETLNVATRSAPQQNAPPVEPTVEDVTESFVAAPEGVAVLSETAEAVPTTATSKESVTAPAVTEEAIPEGSSPHSPRDSNALTMAAFSGVTSAAAATVGSTLTSEGTDEQAPAASESATSKKAEKPIDTSRDQKHRYGQGPIWKLWGLRTESQEGGTKLNTPAAVEAQSTVQEGIVHVEETASSVDAAEPDDAPTPREVREFWNDQDKQPKEVQQPSYVAAVGAKYGPESTYEPAPAVEKIQVGEARAQGSAPESLHGETSDPASGSASTVDGVIMTETTTTTVEETEVTEYALRMQQVAATAALASETDLTIETEDKVAAGSPSNLSASAVSSTYEEREEGPSSGGRRSSAEVVALGGKIRESERRTTALTEGDLMEPDVEMVAEDSYVEVASPREDYRHGEPAEPWMVKPCTIGWNNLRLTRENCKGASAMQLGDGDVVLSELSGSVKAGEFLVITGPSKGESLALLSCLAGYQDAMEGNVTVNGRKWNKAMDRYVAYVQREDLFFETLTVHEHLVAQAQLRMRRTHSDEKCLERVEAVIEEMGLASCRDKLIGGGVSVRGISRGERKLLALATALLTNPSILLVEEPTDGLDTFVAERIVAKLRHLAFERGLTVAVTLHHPASHFYALFDVLYLIAESSCVYDGKAQDCVSYFATLGYQCPLYMSPMDYFLIQMVVGDRESDDEGAARLATLKREWTNRNAEVYAANEARAEAASEESAVSDYDRKSRYYHMGCCGQLWLLWARHIQRLSRFGFVFGWYALAALVIGVIFGLVYLQLDLDNQQGIQNFAGAFFYAVVVQILFHAYRTFVFAPRETAIALRERQEYRGSWYYLACWYMTKIAAELPALIVLSILLFAPMFLLVGIGHGFTVYVYMQILIVLAGWSAIALGFLTLGVLRRVTFALVVYCVLLILFVVFGGLLINVSDIPDWLIWLHYISPVKYAHEAMMKIFWVREDAIGCDFSELPCIARTGDEVLEYYGMESRSALGDTLILLGICLALFFVAFWFLLVLAQKRINGFQWRFQWTFSGLLGNRQQRAVGARMDKDGTADHNSVRHVMASKNHNSSLVAAKDMQSHTGEQELSHYIQVETPRIGGHTQCDAQRITLGWSSLWLKKPVAKKQKKTAEVSEAPTQKEYLLSDASGSAKCGEVVLITGPSDHANVALLESLGGFQSKKKLRGRVTMNGEPSTLQQTDELVAYVPRDELFHETLTVQEHLRFQAQLCAAKGKDRGCGLLCCGGGGTSALEHPESERVEAALEEMELQTQRHVLIRYLSLADRKLLAIATALLSNPSVLMVEEPTHAGEGETLDFHAAQRVVLKLRQLARSGRTVVVTMAHPSSHVLALFDTLYLLAAGAAVYHGKVSEAVPYFASLGYECPEYESPVDFLARQVTAPDGAEGNGQIQAAIFKEAWSTRYSELLCLQEDGMTTGELATSSHEDSYHRHHLGCCGQLTLLFRRHVLRLARYRFAFLWHALFAVVAGVIFGLIFLKLDPRYEQGDIQNVAGALFYLVVLEIVLMAARTLAFLPHELHIAEREHGSGSYYLVCWFVTKLVAEIPSLLALSVIFFVPAYLLIDFGHGFELYVCMQMVLALCGWGAIALTMLAMTIFRRMRVALLATAVVLSLFMVFGGLLVNVDDVPDYLIWLHYISPVKFGYESLMKLFWTRMGLLICGETGGDGSGSGSGSDASYSNGFPNVGDEEMYAASGFGSGYGSGSSGSYYEDDGCIAHSGEEVLEHFSMEESERTAQADALILLELVVLYFFLAYAILSLRWRSCKTRPRVDSRTLNDY